MWKDTDLVAVVEGTRHTVLVPGVGYCFPDRSCAAPETGDVVHVIYVIDMGHRGKQFGYYIWEPYHTEEHSIADLVRRYLELLKSDESNMSHTLYYTVYTVQTKHGPAYFLNTHDDRNRNNRYYLFGSPKSIELSPVTEVCSSMFEALLVNDAFCRSEDEAIESIQLSVIGSSDMPSRYDPEGILFNIMNGRREASVFCSEIDGHTVSYIDVGGWSHYYGFLVKGLFVLGFFAELPYYLVAHVDDMDHKLLVRHIPTWLVCSEFGKPMNEIFKDFRTIRTGSGQFRDDLEDLIETLPTAVQHVLQSPIGVGFDYMYPDYLCFDVDVNPNTLFEIRRHATVEEFYEFLEYAVKNNARSLVELERRAAIINTIYSPINSVAVPADHRGVVGDHSEALINLLNDQCIDIRFTPRYLQLGTTVSSCIPYISVYAPDDAISFSMFQLVKDRTADELKSLVDEINMINTQAMSRIESATKSNKLRAYDIRWNSGRNR